MKRVLIFVYLLSSTIFVLAAPGPGITFSFLSPRITVDQPNYIVTTIESRSHNSTISQDDEPSAHTTEHLVQPPSEPSAPLLFHRRVPVLPAGAHEVVIPRNAANAYQERNSTDHADCAMKAGISGIYVLAAALLVGCLP